MSKNEQLGNSLERAGRGNVLEIFQGKTPARPVASVRLDLWHKFAKSTDSLPDEIKGLTVEQVEAELGFAQAARYREYWRVEFRDSRESFVEENGAVTTTLRLPERSLTTITESTPDMTAAGMRPHIKKYPLESDEDYEALITAYKSADVITNDDGFAAFDLMVGGAGLPMLILGPCPAHLVALKYLGYERFFFDMCDKPKLLKKLISAIEDLWRSELWPKVAASSAQLLLHGAHFSSAMTPPPIFDEYFAPYFRDFNNYMHDAGKWIAFHSDADLGCLIPKMVELSFDCADCLATTPLVQEKIEDYLDVWRGHVIAWGGLPSTIFQQDYPIDEYESYVTRLIELAKGRSDVIIGASDNVMPGAEWSRLRFLSNSLRNI